MITGGDKEAQKIGELLCVTLKHDADRCLFDKWTATRVIDIK